MRRRLALLGLACTATVSATAAAWALAAAIPPGRQHRLTIEGENVVTFLPQSGLSQLKVDYKAKIEYIIDTRLSKDPKAAPSEEVAEKKPAPRSKAKAKKSENPSTKVSGAVDLSLHSSEMNFRQNGVSVVEAKMSRSRFQGRLLPEAPVLNVERNEAPLALQEVLKGFDSIAASLLVNDDDKVVNRRYRTEGPQRAVLETILSIHAPIPKNTDSWEAPTQLAMGRGQTAKGILRFEKARRYDPGAGDRPEDSTANDKKDRVEPKDPPPPGPVRVKVSGVLKAEGVIAGNLIKDGTYTVTGEQTYDARSREWTSSRWSVAIKNELSNQAGITVAQAIGNMTVESRALTGAGPSAGDPSAPRL